MSNLLQFTQQHTVPLVAFTEAMQQWIVRMRRRGKAENTIKAYCSDVIDALKYFARRDVHVVGVLSAHDVESWIDDLCVRGLKPRTQARRLTAVRRFLEFCQQNRWCTSNAAADSKVPFRMDLVRAPEHDELMRVINAIPNDGHWLNVRDRAMLRLSYDAALRSGGVCSLDVPWADTDRAINLRTGAPSVRVAQKGGGTTDPIAIDEKTAACVRAWLELRKAQALAKPGEIALFVSRTGGRLDRRSVYQICRHRGAAVGLPNLHPHLFRHRRIGELIEVLGLKVASEHAQHAHVSTTANVYGAHASGVTRKLVRERASLDAMRGAA